MSGSLDFAQMFSRRSSWQVKIVGYFVINTKESNQSVLLSESCLRLDNNTGKNCLKYKSQNCSSDGRLRSSPDCVYPKICHRN